MAYDKFSVRSSGMKETSNQDQGKTGSETKKFLGPANRGSGDKGQSANQGGVFRATRGRPGK
jgi:hypothetical protein